MDGELVCKTSSAQSSKGSIPFYYTIDDSIPTADKWKPDEASGQFTHGGSRLGIRRGRNPTMKFI